jgi:hypothetical protein
MSRQTVLEISKEKIKCRDACHYGWELWAPSFITALISLDKPTTCARVLRNFIFHKCGLQKRHLFTY